MIQFRLQDFFAPHRVSYWRWKLWRTQYASRCELAALQLGLLNAMLEHCKGQVPFYRGVPSRLGSLEELRQLPILDKDTLQDAAEEFVPLNVERLGARDVFTSGSTGTPLRVRWDLESNVVELVSQWRHYSWAGYRLGQPFLDIRSSRSDSGGLKRHRGCRGLEISIDFVKPEQLDQWVRLIRAHRPVFWRGQPYPMARLGDLLRNAGHTALLPRFIISAGELLHPHLREQLQALTQGRVLDSMGMIEHCVCIQECPQGSKHIASEYGIVEIIGEDGGPVRPGETGRIIATGLHNRAFPLLRYDTRDLAVASDRDCPCGRTLPVIDDVVGRVDELLVSASGQIVSGMRRGLWGVEGLRLAQLVQTRPGELDVHLVPIHTPLDEGALGRIRSYYIDRLGQGCEVRTHQGPRVPHSGPGKLQFVVRLFDIESGESTHCNTL